MLDNHIYATANSLTSDYVLSREACVYNATCWLSSFKIVMWRSKRLLALLEIRPIVFRFHSALSEFKESIKTKQSLASSETVYQYSNASVQLYFNFIVKLSMHDKELSPAYSRLSIFNSFIQSIFDMLSVCFIGLSFKRQFSWPDYIYASLLEGKCLHANASLLILWGPKSARTDPCVALRCVTT